MANELMSSGLSINTKTHLPRTCNTHCRRYHTEPSLLWSPPAPPPSPAVATTTTAPPFTTPRPLRSFEENSPLTTLGSLGIFQETSRPRSMICGSSFAAAAAASAAARAREARTWTCKILPATPPLNQDSRASCGCVCVSTRVRTTSRLLGVGVGVGAGAGQAGGVHCCRGPCALHAVSEPHVWGAFNIVLFSVV